MNDSVFRQIRNVTLIGLFTNLMIAAMKFAAGWFGHSQALIADAIHSLSDSITDIAVIAGAALWNQPPDEAHPYGHRRIETFVTIFIGILLAAAGLGIGLDAVTTFSEPPRPAPALMAVYAALASVISKEILYRWTHRVGIAINSSAVTANAWHHRLDAISSVPACVAIIAAILFPEIPHLDAIGALVVAVFVFQAAIRILWPNIQELMDKGASPETSMRIRELASACAGVHSVHRIRTRFQGTRIFADLHLVVDGNLTVREGHDIAETVKTRLLAADQNLEDVVIHVEPPEAIPRLPS